MSEPNQPIDVSSPPEGTTRPPQASSPPSVPPPPPGWTPPPLPGSPLAASFVSAQGAPPLAPGWSPGPWAGQPPIQAQPSQAPPFGTPPYQAPLQTPPLQTPPLQAPFQAPFQTPPSPRRSRGWVGWVVAGLVVALLAGGGLLWYLAATTPPGTPGATSSPVGPSASASPTASIGPIVLTRGGHLGVERPLKASAGEAVVTATQAAWGDTGTMPPQAGMTYLVVDVTISGRRGTVPVGAVFTAAVTADQHRYGIAYGPATTSLLPSKDITPGDVLQGQLGFQVPKGPVTIEFLDADGTAMGTVEIPSP